MSKNFGSLSHLEKSIPTSIVGYSVGFYSIALEAWRRGITLKFINSNRSKPNVRYQLKYKNKKHTFISSRGDLTNQETLRICRNKHTAKKYLQAAGVPTPEGKFFESIITNEEIMDYANKKNFPLVIKPVDGSGGKGVVAGIRNKKDFAESLEYVRNRLGYKEVIVERYFEGEDLRVYVVGKEVVGIIKRIPANVEGDGVNNIRDLIKKKNKIRKKSPILVSSLIKIDRELNQTLKRQGLNLDSIPQKNKVVYLKTTNNISTGGDPIDITDEIPEKIKQTAIDAVNSIPNLPNAGVDLMVNIEKEEATVIEINTQASIRSHLFPIKGKARDIPRKIIDYYFPETKNLKKNNKIYFDFKPIWELFREGKVEEYTLPTIPEGRLKQVRFIVSGRVHNVNLGSWIRRQARDLELHGHVKHLNGNQTEIVVLGENKKIDTFKKIISDSNSKHSHIANIVEKRIETPIKAGFRIINPELDKLIKDGYYPVRVKDISKLRRPIKGKRKKQNNEEKYKKELEKVLQSKSWKITKPLRKLRNFFKTK